MADDITSIALSAEKFLREEYEAGRIELIEHAGMRGAWASTPFAKFFVALSTPADRSYVPEGGPDEELMVWAPGKRGRHVQIHIDTRSGLIRNFDDIKDALEELEEMQEADESMRNAIDEEEPEAIGGVDLDWWCAVGQDGDIQLLIDYESGDVMNWASVEPLLDMQDATTDIIELKEVHVRPHTKKDGTRVGGYTQERREAKHSVEGHRFLGHAKTASGEEYEVHQNQISRNQFALLHPETGEYAPEGTVTGPWEGYSGSNVQSILQGKANHLGRNVATPVRDTEATERGKADQILAVGRSLRKLKEVLPEMLAKDDSKEQALALAVMMISRHLFRIGDGLGNTKGVMTRGLLELRAHSDVFVDKDRIRFEFLGKAAKQWLRFEEDPATVELLRKKIENAGEGDKLFWYNGEGKYRKNIVPEDVRVFLKEYGFTPHRFRNYAGSYVFYSEVRRATQNGAAETDKERKKLVVAATKKAAEVLNDTPSAAKAYIMQKMVDEVLQTGTIRDYKDLRALDLAEPTPWWWPYEEDFLRYVEATHPGYHHNIESVALSYDLWLWEPLREGDRWVTLKPHGPESDDYVRVIIRQHKDGTATVVGGAKRLLNLRLSKVGERDKIERAEKAKSKVLSPQQAEQERQAREARKVAGEQAMTNWATSLLKVIGADGVDPQELIRAYGNQIKPKKEPRELGESQRSDQIKEIEEGEPVRKPQAIDSIERDDLANAAVQSEVDRMIGMVPKEIHGVSPELAQAWREAMLDPEKRAAVAENTQRLKQIQKELRRQQSPSGTVKVLNRMAFYVGEGEADDLNRQLLADAEKRATYEMTSKFWEQFDNAGVGVRDHFANGAVDAMTAISSMFGGGALLDASIVRLIGHEAVAAAVAADVRARGQAVLDHATERLESSIEEKHLPTVASAMQIAKELEDERKQIDAEAAASDLMTAAAATARTKLTIGRQKALGYAAGSLEAAAATADFMRRKNPDGVWIQPGDERDRIVGLLEKVGLQEGEGFSLGSDEDGGANSIYIPEKHLPKLLAASRVSMDLDTKRAAIKNHSAQKGIEWEVPGMVPSIEIQDDDGVTRKVQVKPKPGQIAAVQMLESEAANGPNNGILVNAKVGLGKTLIQGMAAARLIASGKATHGLVIVPAFLMNSTEEGMKKFFPDMDIQMAHKDKSKRHEQYKNKHQMLIVSLDTVRGDLDGPLREMMASEEHRPGYIFGDEAHLAFTPNANESAEKQSARSQALQELRAPYMMMLTGTPLRRSTAEVWKILNYLRPGQYGSLSAWMARFGRIGEGTSVFGDSMQDVFQRMIDSATITESEEAPVQHKQQTRFIVLSPDQRAAYTEADKKYYSAIKAEGMTAKKKRELLTAKLRKQRETIFGGKDASNSMVSQLKNDLAPHIEAGERGIVHCTSLAAVEAVANAFPPGAMLTVVGDDSREERKRLLQGLNTGMPVVGGRAALGDKEGVVEKIDGQKALVRMDDGQSFQADLYSLESKVIGVAGTSNAQGVLSAGLNLQGTNWNVHFQLPDSGATLMQRDARNLRTGQTKDVTSYYYVPETPASREHWRRLNQDRVRMSYVDDPAAYDNMDLFPQEEVYLPE